MQEDDDSTATQLHSMLTDNGITISYCAQFSGAGPSWMDISWQCLLPAHSPGEQRETATMGSTAHCRSF